MTTDETATLLHPLDTSSPLPLQLNNPFCYEPHPLALQATRQVQDYVAEHSEWADELAAGKMLGVLVCLTASGRPGFLAAYSGQMGGREDWPWFVPAVFDYLQPDGHFKREEAAITAINRRIDAMTQSADYMAARTAVAKVKAEADRAIGDFRQQMAQAKARRDALRASGNADLDALTTESQHQRAELRRMKTAWAQRQEQAEGAFRSMESAIFALKDERRRRSDALQQWLFEQFLMLNAQGERRSLASIFAPTPQRTPPSGAGECCAPKLLQYAFAHGLKPLAMAEFWHGRSPRMEVRHHGQFYPACRGKCKPILEWMLHGVAPTAMPAATPHDKLHTVYADEHLLVVDKPAGLLSVPGKTGEESVESLLRERFPEIHMVHRLDQDTSGLMVVARSKEAHQHLQRQFLPAGKEGNGGVEKRYVALLCTDGRTAPTGSGTIGLPLRPDPLDRPRQVADHKHGRRAVTIYEVLGNEAAGVRVALKPLTGRTHQLRVHCAHAEGLGCPIVGDRLYGLSSSSPRLCLHADSLSFVHPATGQRLSFHSPAPF